LPIAKKIIDNYVQHITYEDLVEKYLWAIGANEVLKPATNESSTDEGDADRVAYFEQLKVAVMVQIKKHDSSTDDWAVNQIELYKNNHINQNEDYNVQLWVISNAEDFTEEAKRKAREANVRLINGDDFANLKKILAKSNSGDIQKLHAHAIAAADEAIADTTKLVFKKDASNKRILGVSRKSLSRLIPCAYAYVMTGDGKYLQKAEKDLLDVCAFESWNPKHYLDVAEMAAGVSMAYDWLFYDLPSSTKDVVSKTLKEYALETSRDKESMWWYKRKGNWNQVCNAGLVCTAVALYDQCPELAKEVIDDAVSSNYDAQVGIYAPDGA
jgi:hypothetical protein